MVLPLLSAYFLFAWVTSYHSDQKVEEYYEVYAELQTIKQELANTELYDPSTSKAEIEQMVSEQLAIALYNKDGFVLYSSNPTLFPVQQVVNKESLYTDLYDLKQGLRAFTYKEPVFEEGEVIGLFEVNIAREELISSIIKRGWIVVGLFVISFILIYSGMAFIVNRRLNQRLYGLMDEMSAFAKGNKQVETETGRDEIGELKQHFYAMRKQITAAQEVIELEQKAKEYMVATISHDLKTPLTSIKAYAESLDTTKELSAKDQAAYHEIIIEKADFMKQMLDDLITHTLLQSHDYELELVSVDGEEFFDMLISDYEALCKKKKIQLTARKYVAGTFQVNPKQLMRVLDNLMINAIQNTPYSCKIYLVVLSELI